MRIPLRLAVVAATIVAGVARIPLANEGVTTTSTALTAGTHDLLAAETAGLVEVRYIPNDARSAQVIVTNKSRKPVSLRLPAAFAGVPVLAQMMGMGMGGRGGAGFGGAGIGGGGQATGGGFGQQGMNGMGGGMGGGGMGGMGGGAFSIPPQKTRVLHVATVCLEHGKPEPSPRHAYKLTAIESFSSDPRLALVLEGLGRGEVPPKVAQAAAWHLSSGLSWDRLAAETIDHAGPVPDEAYFAPAELLAAHGLVEAVTRAAARAPDGSTSAAPSAAQ